MLRFDYGLRAFSHAHTNAHLHARMHARMHTDAALSAFGQVPVV